MTTQPSKGVELVRLENIGVSFPQRKGFLKRSSYWALEDISFSIHQGETIGVVGRNGVGKTTLLRLLSNIISPDRGTVWRKKGLRTVLLSLQAGFIPTLTGRQNAVISGITLGLSRQKIESCIDQVIEFAELQDFIDQPVAAYSAGMRARLGFSVAMHVDPDILLIDEVISVGDEAFRKKSAEVIHERVKANETTVLVTHNTKLAESLCNRIIWIDGGRIRMLGKTKEVLDVYLPTYPVKATPQKYEPAVFLHIQKTAGTSLVHMAARHYGKEGIISHGDYIGRSPESLMNIPFVSGHFGFDYARPLIETRKSFTFLRQPAERILSLYYFYRSQDPNIYPLYRMAHESSLVEFLKYGLEDPWVKVHIWNSQTWQLANGYGRRNKRGINDFSPQELIDLAREHLGCFTFVGLAENFDRDVALVAQELGWPPIEDSIRENTSQKRRTVSDLTSEEKSLIEELTALDNLLYEHVNTTMYQNLRTNAHDS